MARPSPNLLAGNGVALVRERALAAAIQGGLERLYQVDRLADVGAFVSPATGGDREVLLVRIASDGAVEMSLRLPALRRRGEQGGSPDDTDALCQIIEGVSHFVYLAARAREGRVATQLELEVQAEVDKYVVLAASLGTFDEETGARLRGRLYDEVSFCDPAGSETGERYRIANQAAAKFVRRLERDYLCAGRLRDLWRELRRFFRLGQEEKLRAALLM